MVNGCEAYVVLLHDGRIERVEVEEKDETIVEASFWLENQTSRVGRLSPTMPPAATGPLLGTGGLLLLISQVSLIDDTKYEIREKKFDNEPQIKLITYNNEFQSHLPLSTPPPPHLHSRV